MSGKAKNFVWHNWLTRKGWRTQSNTNQGLPQSNTRLPSSAKSAKCNSNESAFPKEAKILLFIFINSANDNYDKEKEEYYGLTVSSNGDVGWFYPTIFKSSCTIDVTYFPFDDQVGENVWNIISFKK